MSNSIMGPGVGPMAASYYEVLGLSRDSSQANVRAAYLRLAQEYHPDLNRFDSLARQEFQQIQKAYEVLRNPHARALYDRDPGSFELHTDVENACSAARAQGRTGKSYGPERHGSQPHTTGASSARHPDSQTPWASMGRDARQLWQQKRRRKISGLRFAIVSIGVSLAALSLIAYNLIAQRMAVLEPTAYSQSFLASAESLVPDGEGPGMLAPSNGSAALAQDSTGEGSFDVRNSSGAETVAQGEHDRADGMGTMPATFSLAPISALSANDAPGLTSGNDYDGNFQAPASSKFDPAMIVPLSWQPTGSTESPRVSSAFMDPAPPLPADMADATPFAAPTFPSVEPLDDEWLRTELDSARHFDAKAIGGAPRHRTDAARFDAELANEPFDSPPSSPAGFGEPSSHSLGSSAPRNTWSNGAAVRAMPRVTTMPQSASRRGRSFGPHSEMKRFPNSHSSGMPTTGIVSDSEFRSQSSGFRPGYRWDADSRPAFQSNPSIPVTGRMPVADFGLGPNNRDLYMPRGNLARGNAPALDRGAPLLQPYSRPGWTYGGFRGAAAPGADRFSDPPSSTSLPAPYRTGFDSSHGYDSWTSSRSAFDGLWQDDGDFSLP